MSKGPPTAAPALKLEGGFPKPIAVRNPDDPNIASLLAEMGEVFAAAGVIATLNRCIRSSSHVVTR